jgi:chemotaxis protein CheY-P-specific phosphatase CheC
MNYSEQLDNSGEMELLMSLSNVLSGSFLKELSELLTVNFSFGHPRISIHNAGSEELEHREIDPSEKVLSIHINYAIGKNKVACEQLLLFPQDAISALRSKASYILDI